MIVHRVLDAFFRTLDVVDAVRERVDRVLGREPKPDPWAVEWPPIDDASAPTRTAPIHGEAPASSETADAPSASREAPATKKSTKTTTKPQKRSKAAVAKADAPSTKATSARVASSLAPTAKAAASKPATSKAASAKSAAPRSRVGRKKSATSNRKGSVDKVGADLDSPRARAIHTRVQETGMPLVREDAEVNGKRVLARTLWALHTAEQAGSEKGLTTNDMAALLHLAAGIEVFATNIGRACRDHADLIAESDPDGRTKRYVLTDEGRTKARAIA